MFNYLAMALFGIGTAVAAVAAAKPAKEELWWLLAVGAGIIVLGIIVRRLASKETVSGAETKSGGLSFEMIAGLINDLPAKCKEVLRKLAESQEYSDGIFQEVDRITKEDLYNIVENRVVLAQSIGANDYPALFGEFSEGERLFNRTWSALCDRHVEEAKASLSQAVEFFESVSRKLRESPARNNQI